MISFKDSLEKTKVRFYSWIKKGVDRYEINELKDIKILRKYRPYALTLIEKQHRLYYSLGNKKGGIEHLFALLILVRLKDFFLSTLYTIKSAHFHSTFVLLRSEVETLYLLRFMVNRPESIKKFMDKNNSRFLRIEELKKVVNDKNLDQFYSNLSDMLHPNRVAIKYTYYIPIEKDKGDTLALITDRPINYESQSKSNLISLLNLHNENLEIIRFILEKKWRKGV